MANDELLNKSQLAAAIGQKPGYITAAIAAGYEMQYGNRTTRRHFLAWRASPIGKGFTTTAYYRAHRGPADDGKDAPAGKSCALTR